MDTAEQPEPVLGVPDSAKATAELRKLEAETRVVEQQLSRMNDIREWLKALTGLAAIGALVWSMVSGIGQLAQVRDDKKRDSLDKAMARLISANPAERIVGVNTTRGFLASSNHEESSAAFMALVAGLVEENDMPVRTALLAAISNDDPGRQTDADLRYAVKLLMNGNRDLFAKSTTQGQLKFWHTGLLPQAIDDHLSDLLAAALVLMKKGAPVPEFDRIYCSHCDFRAVSLQHSIFDKSFLPFSNFSNVDLGYASFKDTALSNTNFNQAKLQHATFSGFALRNLPEGDNAPPVFLDLIDFSADFTGADLTNSSFEGLVIWGIEDRGVDWRSSRGPRFNYATLNGASFNNLYGYFASRALPTDDMTSVLARAHLSFTFAQAQTMPIYLGSSKARANFITVHAEVSTSSKVIVFPLQEILQKGALLREGSSPQLLGSLAESLSETNSTVGKAAIEMVQALAKDADNTKSESDPTVYGGHKLVTK